MTSNTNLTVLPRFLSADELLIMSVIALEASWEYGRQGTGYLKHALSNEERMLLIDPLLRALHQLGVEYDSKMYDCYLLRYPVGSYIPPHRDDAMYGQQHIRLNAIVQSPSAGGEFIVDCCKIAMAVGDAVMFRPDLLEHSVTRVCDEDRLVFSVGALKQIMCV